MAKPRQTQPPDGYGEGDEGDLGLEGGSAPGVAAPELDDGAPIDLALSRKPRNDMGNAQRLIRRHGERLRYVKDVGWLAWHEGRWSLDQGERQAELLAQDVVDRLRDEADSVEEAGAWKRETPDGFQARVAGARKWAVASGNSGKITGMLGRAQAHLTVLPDVLDAHPRRFCVANGTIVLGLPCRLEPHEPRDLITMISPVAWVRGEEHAPHFHRFIEQILPDEEVRAFVQRFLGYCLSGLGTEQALLLLHGAGANGKSTLVDLVAYIMGEYAATLNIRSLLRDDRATGSQATPDLARLPGKRFARTSEPEPNAQLAEGKIKELTGGEKITARHLNEGFFEFVPQFKLIVSMNNKPMIRGGDDGIWRRVLLVPFEVQIPREARDKALPDKLKAEAPAVLNWLIDGYEQWAEAGLMVPDAVRAATEAYREENDAVGEFLASVAVISRDPLDRVPAGRLFSLYETWCKRNAQDPLSKNAFGKRLRQRTDIKVVKVSSNFYSGLYLVDDAVRELEGGGGSGPA